MPAAVIRPPRVPPARLFRSTTAVETPGVSTSGTVTAMNGSNGGTGGRYRPRSSLARSKQSGQTPWLNTASECSET